MLRAVERHREGEGIASADALERHVVSVVPALCQFACRELEKVTAHFERMRVAVGGIERRRDHRAKAQRDHRHGQIHRIKPLDRESCAAHRDDGGKEQPLQIPQWRQVGHKDDRDDGRQDDGRRENDGEQQQAGIELAQIGCERSQICPDHQQQSECGNGEIAGDPGEEHRDFPKRARECPAGMSIDRVLERHRTRGGKPVQMRGKRDQTGDGRDPRRLRREIGPALRMCDCGNGKGSDQEDRVIFAEHGDGAEHAGGCGPDHCPRFERAQEAVGRKRPDGKQHRVGVEALGVELIGRQQHQQQNDDDALVTAHIAARDQVDRPERNGGIDHREQFHRPVGGGKNQGPDMSEPAHQGRVFAAAPGEGAADRPRLKNVRVQIARDIRDAEIQHPDGDKDREQRGYGPSALDPVQPCFEGPSPRGGSRPGQRRRRQRNGHVLTNE